MSDIPFYAKNGIVANTGFTANSSSITLGGANVVISSGNGISLASGTTNVTINSTAIVFTNSTFSATVNAVTGPGGGTSNQNATYVWTNNHTFNANVTFSGGTVDFNANILNQTLSFAANTAWDTSLGQVATLTLTGNTLMSAPTNVKVGTYILHIIQDATGSRAVTWNTVFKWPQGVAPVLTTTASHRDIISFISDGTNLYGAYLPDVR